MSEEADTAPAETASGERKIDLPQHDTLAVMDLGSTLLGISVLNMREVVNAPASYQPVPSGEKGVVGAFMLRKQIIPVIDLPVFLGVTDEPSHTNAIVVIVEHDNHLIGLRARGTARLVHGDACTIEPLRHAPNHRTATVTGQLIHDGEAIYPMLDVAALFAENIPAVRLITSEQRDWSLSDRYLLFKTDGVQFCMPLEYATGTVADSYVEEVGAESRICYGMIRSHGIRLALVDVFTLLGLATERKSVVNSSAVIVKGLGDQRIALRVDSVIDIIRVSERDIGPIPPGMNVRHGLAAGSVSRGDEDHFIMLDFNGLHADQEFVKLGNLSHKQDAAGTFETDTRTIDSNEVNCLVFNPNALAAIAVENVIEILPWRETLPLGKEHVMIGTISHGGHTLPIYRLDHIIGREVEDLPRTAAIVVVRHGDRKIGFAIRELCAIEVLSVVPQKKRMIGRIAYRRMAHGRQLLNFIEPDELEIPQYAMG
ncbi:chemotaxis protein CheW [Marivivens aquimaris]|uniref:chemotaxis protein CheW n=1 Tax=Marivivens aquimaris TaxID=2774876 RepID=UPI0018825FEF|nr:chemotaxis protein CheW [Marivivens aquimaris]